MAKMKTSKGTRYHKMEGGAACPVHHVDMHFDPTKCMFICPDPHCGIKAAPVVEESVGRVIPKVFAPPLCVVEAEGHYYLTTRLAEVFILLDDAIDKNSYDPRRITLTVDLIRDEGEDL